MSETITRNVIQNYLRNIDTYDYVFFEYLVSQHTSAHLEDTLSTKVSKQNISCTHLHLRAHLWQYKSEAWSMPTSMLCVKSLFSQLPASLALRVVGGRNVLAFCSMCVQCTIGWVPKSKHYLLNLLPYNSPYNSKMTA